MSIQRTVLLNGFVKPFYRQHAALLVFFYFMMTLAVGRANGVGLLEYHYALIKGIMTNPSFLLVVLIGWLIYALKCSYFIMTTLRKEAFSYLYLLSLADPRRLYLLLLQMQVLLFLPVFSYVLFVLKIGVQEGWYVSSALVLLFNVVICVFAAGWHLYLLQHPETQLSRTRAVRLPRTGYNQFLFTYVFNNCKGLLLLTKLYNCLTLYLMLDDRTPALHTDLRMEALFFSAGMLGHGILIHRLKEMENTRLSFNRSLPISLNKRFAQYALFYGCLLIPELMIIVTRTPAHLTYTEAGFFIFFGYGILLLLNSLQLYNYSGLKDYLKNVALVFFAVMLAMIANMVPILSAMIFILAIVLFYRRYYKFDPTLSSPA